MEKQAERTGSGKAVGERAGACVECRREGGSVEKLDEQALNLVLDWYHFGILELVRTKDFKLDARWISRRLNIADDEVERAFARLEKVGLLKREGNNVRLVIDQTYTDFSAPSVVVKKFHEQMLKKATAALYTQPLKTRTFESYILAVDHNRVAEAKNKIKNFMRDLNEELDSSPEKSQVYCLSTQFFLLSPGGENA